MVRPDWIAVDWGTSRLRAWAMAGEQVSLQHATVLSGISRGRLLDTERTLLAQSFTRHQDKLDDFSAVATPQQQADYRATVASPDVDLRNSLFQLVRSDPDAVRTGVSVDAWNKGSETTGTQIAVVLRSLEDQLTDATDRMVATELTRE